MNATKLPTAPGGPRLIELRADNMVPGLFLTYELPAGDGEWRHVEPLKITAIDEESGRLVFTFHTGQRVPFHRDQVVSMVCIPAPHPAWCVECGFDTDGTSRHGTQVRSWGPNDADEVMTVSGYRYDDPDGTYEPPAICLTFGAAIIGEAFDELTPAAARALGRMLIETADELGGAA